MSIQHTGKGTSYAGKNHAKGYLDTQVKVRDATSSDPWGPSIAQMNEIAQMSYNQDNFVGIVQVLDERLNEKAENWVHVFKSLVVVNHCLHTGSEDFVAYLRDNLNVINTLTEFQCVDKHGEDQGANIRQKAKHIAGILSNNTKLREERRLRTQTRDRMAKATGGSGVSSAAARRRPAPLQRDLGEAPRRGQGEEELEAVTQDPTDEALSIVHDLNRGVSQIAADVTEAWVELGSSRSDGFTINENDIDTFSQSYGPDLVHRVLDRNPAAVAFLVRSCLCKLVTQISSSWRSDGELGGLRRSADRQLPDSGYEVPLDRLRSLAKAHLSKPSSHSLSITRHVADVLWITGSFQSTRDSFDFVKKKVFDGIEAIDQLTRRLEYIFIVDILSGDMCLLFESPYTEFDGVSMARAFELDEGSIPADQNKVTGTMEVGLGKSVFEERSGAILAEVLLRAKVVLEWDLAYLIGDVDET